MIWVVKPQSSRNCPYQLFWFSWPDPRAISERLFSKMNEEPSINPSAVPDQSDADIVPLLKRMQQQLSSLEKKIDTLINQSQEKPFREKSFPNRPFRGRSFSKPLRSFDQSQRNGKGEREYGPREHGSRERDAAQGRFYERRQRDKNRGSDPKKKPFFFKRKDRE
jgi:hypothetical protein